MNNIDKDCAMNCKTYYLTTGNSNGLLVLKILHIKYKIIWNYTLSFKHISSIITRSLYMKTYKSNLIHQNVKIGQTHW